MTAHASRYLLFGTERYALPILGPLARAARARGAEVAWFLHGVPREFLPDGERLLESVTQVRAFRPTAVFAASNWVPDFFPGLKVQVFHGFNVEKRDAAHGHFRIRGLFDLYCTQGPATTAPFRAIEARHRNFRVVETGWPKLDPLLRPDPARIAALRAAAVGRPVVGFGSTFTDSLSGAPHLIDSIGAQVAGGPYYWLLTLHPKCPSELVARYRGLSGANAQFVETEQMIELLAAADVLVADTSSIVSEFVVQKKPVVTFRNRAPKPHMIDIQQVEQLPAALHRALHADAPLRAALAAYAGHIHPYDDGRSSERVLDAADAFVAQGRADLRALPLNLWRKLQMRQKLSWWRA